MASEQPFEPAVKSGATGLTVSVVVSATTQFLTQVNSTGGFNPTILVTLDGATNGTAFIRMSVESSTAITASTTDTPFPYGNNPTIRLFANPNPTGITNIAIVTASAANPATTIWFTPGQGGIF